MAIKMCYLYQPLAYSKIKYARFFEKLKALVGNDEYLKNIYVKTPDSQMLDVVYLKNPVRTGCIIYCHGNTGNIFVSLFVSDCVRLSWIWEIQ
jgi:hypothetical protein